VDGPVAGRATAQEEMSASSSAHTAAISIVTAAGVDLRGELPDLACVVMVAFPSVGGVVAAGTIVAGGAQGRARRGSGARQERRRVPAAR
jgi:hypothetical protein